MTRRFVRAILGREREAVLFALWSQLLVLDSPRAGRLRAAGLAWQGAHVGADPFICRGFELYGPAERLWIGDNVFVNAGCRVDVRSQVRIGSRVSIGPGVTLWTTRHELGGPDWRAGRIESAPIVVGDGAWIGANATVLGGVVVGAGSLVAAGAVVIRDVEPHTLVGGVPAKLLRRFEDGSNHLFRWDSLYQREQARSPDLIAPRVTSM
jgi:acetyltransferase-like isoleucine patch superfamily enzyme